jgi:hypothetical protein
MPLRVGSARKLWVKPAFACYHAPKWSDSLLSRAPLFVRSFSSNPHEDSRAERASCIHGAAPGQLLAQLKHCDELALRHAANQSVNIERTGNDHAAFSQAALHTRRNVDDLRLLLAFKFFPPRNSATEFRWHGRRSGVDRTAWCTIMQQLLYSDTRVIVLREQMMEFLSAAHHSHIYQCKASKYAKWAKILGDSEGFPHSFSLNC